jgi:oligopeptide/dipeptide ABC transporter ATP-binding protein
MAALRPLLEVKDLHVVFHTYRGDVKALNGVDLTVYEGEVVGLVGETGSGKSVTALSIVGLLPENAEVVRGQVLYRGRDLLKEDKETLRELRATRIAMVFQDPMTFLNPVLTIGDQLTEIFASAPALLDRFRRSADGEGRGIGKRGDLAKRMAAEALRKVRMPSPEEIMTRYPHELSGGMRQRAMIAMALVRNPDLLIADEITTALDVTIQAQILDLLKALRRELASSVLMITHDLGVVAEICDRIYVMYGGRVVETAPTLELFTRPLHPYTQGLLRAIPRADREVPTLAPIPGTVPDLLTPPSGCMFHPRCPFAWKLCRERRPGYVRIGDMHVVACHLYGGEGR